jgi:hypothetical protein
MFNRFSYVGNRPINFNDPSGHAPIDCIGSNYCGTAKDPEYVLDSQFKPKPPKPKAPHCQSRACDPNIPTREEVEEFFNQCEKSLWSLSGCTSSNFTVPEINEPIPHELGLACVAPPKPIEIEVVLGAVRDMCGEVDPFLPGGPFVGTDLSYVEAVRSFANALQLHAPNNPYSKSIIAIAPIIPPSCTVYNVCYDNITNTGEYNININEIRITPQGIGYTILAILIAIPIILPFP